jgi:hypothetical protein
MLENMQPIEVGWYDWDYRLAAVANGYAFVLSENEGWRRVNAAGVTWDGKLFENAGQAINAFSMIWEGINPTIIAAYIIRGIAPPKPRRYSRYFLVHDGIALQGRDDFTGNVLVEFDDGSMRKINGQELSVLSMLYPRLKKWRLPNRENF